MGLIRQSIASGILYYALDILSSRSLSERFAVAILMFYLCLRNIVNVVTGYEGFIPYTWEL